MSSIIEHISGLTVGTVEFIAPDEMKIVLEPDAPQATALNAGQPSRFPRVNGFVLIPNEAGAIVGLVSWLGIERSTFPKRTGLRDFGLVDLPFPLRKMSVNPVGTLRSSLDSDGHTTFRLERGVSVFPSVGDSVLLPTAAQLRAIVEAEGEDRRLQIGKSPLAGNALVSVDPDKLFGRHLAILGNTGSGKSCTAAGLIRWSFHAAATHAEGNNTNSRFIILDPNGEYIETFADLEDSVCVFQAPPPEEGKESLRVPAWIWNSQEWTAFAQAAPATQRPLLLQALRNLRAGAEVGISHPARLARLLNGYRAMLSQKISQGPSGYAQTGPATGCGKMLRNMSDDVSNYVHEVPEAAEGIQRLIDSIAGATSGKVFTFADGGTGFNAFTESELIGIREDIEEVISRLPEHPEEVANEDAPIPFDVGELADHVHLLASHADIGQAAQFIDTLTMRIRMMLADQRLGPIVAPSHEESFEAWLKAYMGTDEGSGHIAVIDLSLIPADVIHLVIAVISRVIFEATQRYQKLMGEGLPTVLVLEEAHTFLQRRESPSGGSPGSHLCRETFERIAREGRKFGLGLVVSSQRPSELSETALAQCNTFLLHRIVNDRDQELVKRLVPDNVGGLLRELPNLPARQAVLLGWATPVPVLVEVNELPREHQPRSFDPNFWNVWTGGTGRSIDWSAIALDWAGSEGRGDGESPDDGL